MVVAIYRQPRGSINHSWSWTVAAASGSGVLLFAMRLLLFLSVKGGVSLTMTTVGSSKDVLASLGASNVGSVGAGGVVTSVIVESLSVDPSNVPAAVVTVAAVGGGTALTEWMFNLEGQIVVPPRSYAALTKVIILFVVAFFITSTWVMMP